MGGGKSGPAPERAKPINTTTVVGDELAKKAKTNKNNTEKKEDAVQRKRKGTRGLQMSRKPKAKVTPASTGIQI